MTDTPRFGDAAGRFARRGKLPKGDLLPIIPPGAKLSRGTKLKKDHLGKVPGVFRNGAWSGLTGSWPTLGLNERDQRAVEDMPTENVGLRAADWPAVDCDVENPKFMSWLRKRVTTELGFAPTRVRSNSPRSLFVYRRADGETIRKMQLIFTDPDGVEHKIEVLGEGQQYVVNGMHPSGVAYEWEDGAHLVDVTVGGLTSVTEQQLRDFLTALAAVIPQHGGVVVRLSLPGRGAGAQGQGVRVSDLEPVVDPALVLDALRVFKNDQQTLPAREQIVAVTASFKGSLGAEADKHRDAFTAWATAEGWADEAYVDTIWDSLPFVRSGPQVIFGYARKQGWHGDAVLDFDKVEVEGDDAVDKQIDAAKSQQTEEQQVLQAVADTLVYHPVAQRWIVRGTGEMLSHSALNTAPGIGTRIAVAGATGKNTASNKLVNSGLVQLVCGVTYLPAKSQLTVWESDGRKGLFYNRWHDTQEPLPATASDADIQPWLDHLAYLFPDVSERDTLIDWLAYTVQHRGGKIRWAPIIIGDQGVGKDVLIKPLVWYLAHNYTELAPNRLFGQFNSYLERELIVVQELSRFDKIESYEKLKALIAGTAGDTTMIERKYEAPYSIPNVTNFLFFSNHDDALKIDSDDRRFYVIKTTAKPKDPTYYAGLIDDFYRKQGGWRAVVRWLKDRNLSQFKTHQCPQATTVKREMVVSQAGYFPNWLGEQLDKGEWKNRTVITAGEIFSAVHDDFNLPLTQATRNTVKNSAAVARALKQNGWHNVNKNVRINGGNPCTVWVRDMALADLDATQLRDLCEQELSKTPTPIQKEFEHVTKGIESHH